MPNGILKYLLDVLGTHPVFGDVRDITVLLVSLPNQFNPRHCQSPPPESHPTILGHVVVHDNSEVGR
jgi:hypothetical protein